MNAKAFVIGILLMIPAVGYSHHISGKVLDAKSKKAIEFATVWIEGTGIGTITDTNGHFLLPHLSEDSYDLIIRCLGYAESKNVRGLDSASDPDAFKETYSKKRDYAFWSSLSFQYLIHSSWLSNLRWGLAFAYADKQSATIHTR